MIKQINQQWVRLSVCLFFGFFIFSTAGADPTIKVAIGSKTFTESYILGELLAQRLEKLDGVLVDRKLGLGATGVLFEALKKNEIQLYAEYTGTISEAILKKPNLKDFEAIQNELSKLDLIMSQPLGFNNTYALALRRKLAEELEIQTISDLKKHLSRIRVGFSHEFLVRADGAIPLAAHYGFAFDRSIQSMEHSLSYEAVGNNSIDLIDVYSTDPKIQKFDLKVLKDDRNFFPNYLAVILARKDFKEQHPLVWQVITDIEGSLSEDTMRELNSGPDLKALTFSQTVRNFLGSNEEFGHHYSELAARIQKRTHEHLILVGLTLLFSIAIGIPLGVIAHKTPFLSQSILLFSGLVQTIPSLALMSFLIPFFGIGLIPALIALCLYGLLPVAMNTFVGIRSIDPQLIEVAHSLRLSPWRRLVKIELPLASPAILTGIRTSAVISIGTATLAALIGAGGFGAPILAGLAMNDTNTILVGAVPAAVMALLAHGLFEILGRVLIPKGIRSGS